MQRYVIIVAGGKGLRMGSEIPKQFLPLYERPVLMHTIEAFYNAGNEIMIIIVLPEEQQSYWKELCMKFDFHIAHHVVTGGDTRFHSVQNGLKLVPGNVLVGVHDGVRPLVSSQIINDSYQMAQEKGVAFPVIPLTDTLRMKTAFGSLFVNRADYYLVQTPQVFMSDILQEAYCQPYSELYTDDISVVESLSKYPVFEVAGKPENIKITTPFDLIVAEAVIKYNINN